MPSGPRRNTSRAGKKFRHRRRAGGRQGQRVGAENFQPVRVRAGAPDELGEQVESVSRRAGRGQNVVAARQNRVARSHIEQPLTNRVHQGLDFADHDGVFACGQMGNADIEIFPVDFFVKCRRIVRRPFDGHRGTVLAMHKIPVDVHLLITNGTDFFHRMRDRHGQTQTGQADEDDHGNQFGTHLLE